MISKYPFFKQKHRPGCTATQINVQRCLNSVGRNIVGRSEGGISIPEFVSNLYALTRRAAVLLEGWCPSKLGNYSLCCLKTHTVTFVQRTFSAFILLLSISHVAEISSSLVRDGIRSRGASAHPASEAWRRQWGKALMPNVVCTLRRGCAYT